MPNIYWINKINELLILDNPIRTEFSWGVGQSFWDAGSNMAWPCRCLQTLWHQHNMRDFVHILVCFEQVGRSTSFLNTHWCQWRLPVPGLDSVMFIVLQWDVSSVVFAGFFTLWTHLPHHFFTTFDVQQSELLELAWLSWGKLLFYRI